MTLDFEQEYETETEIKNEIEYEEIAQKVINAALDYEKCPFEAEISLTLVNNDTIQKINREFRNIDAPTDVLSFPLVEYEQPGKFDFLNERDDCFNPESGELMLGDIIISLDKVFEQSAEYGHSLIREYAFLIAHSMLHLMGYDHIDENDAKIMEQKQEDILQGLGICRQPGGE